MSKIVMLLFLLFFCAGLNAQTVQDQDGQSLTTQQQYLKHKIERYTKTRNTGTTLIFTGIIAGGAGMYAIVSYITDEVETDDFEDDDGYDTKYYLGLIGLELGIDMVIGGVIMHTIGSRKIRQYNQKLNKLSLGVNLQPNSKGFTLCYRF